MKKTTAAPTIASPARLADLDALRDLYALIDQRRIIEQHATQIPDLIKQAEKDVTGLDAEIADCQIEILHVSEKNLPDVNKRIETLENKQLECRLRTRRLKTQLAAIEARAPALDEQIDLAIGLVRLEATMASEQIQTELAEEIRNAAADLRTVFAKVRALQKFVPMPRTSDFLLDAFVPDLESCVRLNSPNGQGSYNQSPNLLAFTTDDTRAAEAAIAEQLKPLYEALAAARSHKPYVPIAKRPAAYVFQGSNAGPGFGRGGPIGEPGPPPAVEAAPSAFKGYQTDKPYEIRGDQSGVRTRQAAAEMNMTAAIAAQTDSAERQ